MQPHLKVGNGAIITDHLSIINHQLLIDRGYTSHEHFSEVGIIHMNGRLYDPLLRRFLNADENIQDPHNTQNYNKYGYVMNNPLMYNDPNGEFFFFGVLAAWLGSKLLAATIIGAVIGLASYTVGVLVSTGSLQSWNIGGALKATFFGAVGGAVTFGIGSIFQTSQGAFTALGSVLDKAGVLPLVQAGAHGISQGVLSLMQGGDFLSGAAAGFLGSLGASGFGIIAGEAANSAVGTIAFGALSGGIGAELTGGNFWQGAVIGGIVAGLNHVLHGIDGPLDNGGDDGPKPRKGFAGKKVQKVVEKSNEYAAYGEAATEFIKQGMLEMRGAMPLNKKIGTFKQFSKYFKYVKTAENGIALFSYAGTGASVLMDYNAYLNGDISGAVLTYRTVGNVASLGAGYYTGPTGGLVVSQTFSLGERLLNRIALEMTRINASNGYFLNNFHP